MSKEPFNIWDFEENWQKCKYKVEVRRLGEDIYLERLGFENKPTVDEALELGKYLAEKWGEGTIVTMNWAAV